MLQIEYILCQQSQSASSVKRKNLVNKLVLTVNMMDAEREHDTQLTDNELAVLASILVGTLCILLNLDLNIRPNLTLTVW